MTQFKVQGGHALHGSVRVSGSKNAVLPILAATLLTDQPSILENVPDISDVRSFLKILESLGARVTFENHIATIDPSNLASAELDEHLVKHMRASILLLGPLLARFQEANMAFPGGCVLGQRSAHAHLVALQKLGATLLESETHLHFNLKTPKSGIVILPEASVTATENALMLAVSIPGLTEIRWAAMEPHVQDLCHFLQAMGADIQGVGSPTLIVNGGKPLRGVTHRVIPDYLEAGTLALAGILAGGDIIIQDFPITHLDSFMQKLEECGTPLKVLSSTEVQVQPRQKLQAIEKLQTSVYPGFPTDLQAPFTVLLTQCEGESQVHETLFEGRLNYLNELERMGAQVELLNPHQALITGVTSLRGTAIASYDIRAGAAMLLAALVAQGETTISDIRYIDRGYEGLDAKLRSLGAKIERIQDNS